jgi:membrane associated rhomboid family serine protease
MLSELSQEIEQFTETSKQYIPTMLTLLAGLWLFNYVNWKTGSKLNRYGIWPRHAQGLPGILFAPFLHANFNHLLFNSVPLFFLGLFVMTLGLTEFYIATVVIVLVAGLGVWIFGRNGIHIGASALIAGYFGYVLASAYQHPTISSLFCAAIAMYYFGGILFSLFPTEATVSWEGHLIGFLAGLLAMFINQHYLYTILEIVYRIVH